MKTQLKYRLVNNEFCLIAPYSWDTVSLPSKTELTENFKQLTGVSFITGKDEKGKPRYEFIEIDALKKHFNRLKKDWFGIGEKNTYRAVGVFWLAFMTYIFPWMLDIAKVYCAFQIAQAFYKEGKGGGREGKTGFQSLVHYGKWYLAFWLIPWGVELIDQIGGKMHTELMNGGIEKLVPATMPK